MKIAIGTDHRGYALKEFLKQTLLQTPSGDAVTWYDVGCDSDERCDYPPFSVEVAHSVRKSGSDVGLLLCGSGNGMAIAANRFVGIYAALAWNIESARLAKSDDNANILVLPSDFLSEQDALNVINAWLAAEFKAGRYQKRLAMIDELGGA